MSDPNNTTFNVLLGAGIAILGSIVSQMFMHWIFRQKEKKYIKKSIQGEVDELYGIIKKCEETHSATNQVGKEYINELVGNMRAFEKYKLKLYGFKKDLRNSTLNFYRDLGRFISKEGKKAGTLEGVGSGDQGKAIEEQQKIMTALIVVKGKAENLQKKLEMSLWENCI